MLDHRAQRVALRQFLTFSLLLALLVACILPPAAAAKKKKKASKTKEAEEVDGMRCATCITAVEEIQMELATTENSTNTLDLRWGLTAEVTEGRAKRIGKVIPYKRSELRSIEVMERVCGQMKNYGTTDEVHGETRLKLLPEHERFTDKDLKAEAKLDDPKKKAVKKFMQHCQDLVDENEERITVAIRDAANDTQLQDLLCYGEASKPCGLARTPCFRGTFSPHMGLSPCFPCPHGTYADQHGQTECTPCPQALNTTGKGTKNEKECLPKCPRGHSSHSGLGVCAPCQKGTYQPSVGQRYCFKCPEGMTTAGEGALKDSECVSACGDGLQSANEACDDNNTESGDGCSAACEIEAGAVCALTNGSLSTCRMVTCGDKHVDTAADGSVVESCDDGNSEGGDGCSSSCSVEEGWGCKPGTGKDLHVSVCHRVVCGDFKRQFQEECDDGNTNVGDGCDATCAVEAGFMCVGPLDRKSNCKPVRCGDGVREGSGDIAEECDDGNTAAGDGCSADCKVEEGFFCKKSTSSGAIGPAGSYSFRKDKCKPIPECGNGRRVKGEACDDGNAANGDGCSAKCTVEKGWACTQGEDGSPDVCTKKEKKATKKDDVTEKPKNEEL